jgi:predicted aspartyl protease
MLDSGASANFMSREIADRLEIDYDLDLAKDVKLADG